MAEINPEHLVFDHELTFGELFRKSFEFTRKYYLSLLPVFVAFGIVSTIISTAFTYATPNINIPQNLQTLSQSEILALAGGVFQVLGYTFVNYIITLFILYFAVGIGIWRIDKQLRHDFEIAGRINYVNLAITTVASVLLISAGLFLFVVGALIVAIMLYLSLTASVIEGKSGLQALGRSRKLVSGQWGKTFGLLAGVQIAIAIFASLISGLVGLPFPSSTSTDLLVNAVQSFVMALAFPFVSASMIVLYYSTMARHAVIYQRPRSPYDQMKPQPIGPFPVKKYCPQCGVEVTQEEKFCHNCGSSQSI